MGLRLAVVALLALAACSAAPRVPTATKSGEAHAFRIGNLDAYALKDGDIEVTNDRKTFGLGHTMAEVGDVLAANALPRERTELSIQPLLVKDGARVLLFDAGADSAPWARAGLVTGSLAQTGLGPNDVTDIFISHAHLDHTGGLLTRTHEIQFPNATVHLSAPEWAFMQTESEVASIAKAIAPKVVTFEPGAQLLPEVTAIATPGHTPGHSSYEIASGGDKLLYLGDIAHHFVISLQRPTWPIDFDTDKAAAGELRVNTLKQLAETGERVYAVHFPFPGIGRVQARGDAFAWTSL